MHIHILTCLKYREMRELTLCENEYFNILSLLIIASCFLNCKASMPFLDILLPSQFLRLLKSSWQITIIKLLINAKYYEL